MPPDEFLGLRAARELNQKISGMQSGIRYFFVQSGLSDEVLNSLHIVRSTMDENTNHAVFFVRISENGMKKIPAEQVTELVKNPFDELMQINGKHGTARAKIMAIGPREASMKIQADAWEDLRGAMNSRLKNWVIQDNYECIQRSPGNNVFHSR
jgi:hypothetical protein